MKFIKKSIAVMLMLMAGVPCLYAVPNNSREVPMPRIRTIGEFNGEYDRFVRQGHGVINNRVAHGNNNIAIDLGHLNNDDRQQLALGLNRLNNGNGRPVTSATSSRRAG